MGPEGTARRATAGPYQLGELLGGGGMGLVFRGEAPGGRKVAVKVLRAHLTRDADIVRFLREATIRIDHPNVIEVLDSGVDRSDGTPYIVFELLEGESLEARLARGPLSPRVAAALAAQITDALAAAHAHGVVHRDLKPANVFQCEDGTLKLLDFGIARVADTKLTREGTVVGTLSYLSPEQARGGSDVDARTDVWALGAVLFEMVHGVPPFDRSSPVATLLAIMNERVPRLDDGGAASTALAEVVDRCLRRDPAERWPTAAALGDALRALDALEDVAREMPTEIRPVDADSVADTITSAPFEHRIRPDEQRIVAVLLATQVADMAAVEQFVAREGGAFFPLLGRDAIGLFGAQRWEGDETHRAVRAALECRMAARSVAVGSGRVRASGVGIAGDALRQAEAAGRAALLGVAVDPGTARAIRDAFSLREAGGDVVEVIGERPESVRPASAGDALFGREVEMSQLRAMSSIAFGGRRATLVSLVGPSGIGKSRLRRELARDLVGLAPSPRVLVGQPASRHRSIAFSLWATVLGQRLQRGILEEGWPTSRGLALQSLAREAVPEPSVTALSTFLAELLGVEVATTPELEAARHDPGLMKDRVRRALLDWIGGLTASAPLAILLDDVHWADPASLALLAEALSEHRAAPLFVLLAGRDDVALDAELDKQAILRIRLMGLEARAVGALANRTAGRELDPAIVASLFKRTEGNPLFVEQLVLDLRDGGLLDAAPTELPLPVTVEAALQARLDRLPEADRELLKLSSVIGRAASVAELVALGAPDPTARLEGLAARELVVVRQASAEREGRRYGLRSELTAEVLYQSIVPERRRELHARLGRLLLAGGGDAEEAAGHLERGGVPDEAAAQYASAARHASRRGDSDSVLRCAAAALELGVHDADERFELHLACADAHRYRGDRAAQGAELERALALARPGSSIVRALTERAVWLLRGGELEGAEAAAAAALERTAGLDDPEAHALALGRLGEIRARRGKAGEAQRELEHAAAIAPESAPRLRGMIAEWRGLLAASRGDVAEARARFAEAAAIARAAGDERRAAGNLANLADSLNRIGEHEDASAALREALEACRRVGNRVVEGYVLVNLGYARNAAGASEEGLALVEQALAFGAADPFLGAVARVYRARALRALGRAEEALRSARDAVEALASGGHAPWRAVALAAAARAALAAGRIAEALALSADALALRDELDGIEEDEAEIFLARAEALAAAGEAEGAAAARARGRERLRVLAARIADPAWRERFLRGPAAHRALLVDG